MLLFWDSLGGHFEDEGQGWEDKEKCQQIEDRSTMAQWESIVEYGSATICIDPATIRPTATSYSCIIQPDGLVNPETVDAWLVKQDNSVYK